MDYTAMGQRERMWDNLDTVPRQTRYVYDGENRLRIKNAPEGTLTYEYDGAGHLSVISARKTYTFPGSAPYELGAIGSTGCDGNGLKGDRQSKQVWRMDFHQAHGIRGTGGHAYFTDPLFHYHVLRPGR